MKKIITIAIVIIVLIAIFFIKFNYKKIKSGNNMNNRTAEEIAKYILDINSYEAKEEITVNSNKNENKYIVIEKYSIDNNVFRKEIIKPENLNGIVFLYEGNNLKIENNNLNLSKVYESYPYIGEENTSFIGFLNSYKESQETKIEEINNEVVITVKLKNGNKYIAYKKLFIDKKSVLPIKMEIKDISQNVTVYILYNEIKINNLRREDILAFRVRNMQNDI